MRKPSGRSRYKAEDDGRQDSGVKDRERTRESKERRASSFGYSVRASPSRVCIYVNNTRERHGTRNTTLNCSKKKMVMYKTTIDNGEKVPKKFIMLKSQN